MQKIHIIVSSKGGVGKTSLVYCLHKALQDRKYTTTIFDLNPTNHDIYNLLINDSPRQASTIECDSIIRGDTANYFISRNANWNLYLREHPYNLVGSATDFWYHILRVATSTDSDILIVDTNMHPFNMKHRGNTLADRSHQTEVDRVLSLLGQTRGLKIYIWFIWTRMPLQSLSSNKMFRAEFVNALPRQNNLVLLHVFSPSTFIPDVDINQEISRGLPQILRTIFGIDDNQNLPNEIDFPPFREMFEERVGDRFIEPNAFLRVVNNVSDDLPLFDHYNKISNAFLRTYKGGLPANIIVFPTYYRNLQGWIDQAGIASGNGRQTQYVTDLTGGLLKDMQSIIEQRSFLYR